MVKTAFLLGFLPNPRMYKRINLAKTYGDVNLICWDRGKEMLEPPQIPGVCTEIIKFNAGNDPLARLSPYFKFKKRAFAALKKNRPDILHVQGLDMLHIAYCYKKRVNENVHIIYEIADLHRLLVDKQTDMMRILAQKCLRGLDKKYCQCIDLLIVTSPKYYDSYFCQFVSRDKYYFFPNVPDLSVFKNFKKNINTKFTIGYFGVIRYKNELKCLINSLDENMELLIAGYEESGDEIEQLCRINDNIKWYGRFDFKEKAAELYSQCDCIFAVYDAGMKNCRVAIPNKLYEAVYCKIPILVADDTYVGEIVKDWNVGFAVQHDSQKAISDAIHMLMNDEIYSRFVKGCVNHETDVNLEKQNEELKALIEKFN